MDLSKIKTANMWNLFDEKGLLVGLQRKPGETNIEYHNRIKYRTQGNSTKEGIVNWTIDAFDVDAVFPSGALVDITESFVFIAENAPLTRSEHERIKDPDVTYEFPIVRDLMNDIEFTMEEFSHEYDKADTYTGALTDPIIPSGTSPEWIIYKSDGDAYSNILEANYITDEIEIEYQYIQDNEIFTVVESPRRPE